MRPPTDGEQDAPRASQPALLDDSDVAGSVAHDLLDGGAEEAMGGAGPAFPAEQDQVGLLLARGFEHALPDPRRDPHDRADLDGRGLLQPQQAAKALALLPHGERAAAER